MNYLVPWHTSAEWDDLVDLAQQYLKDGQHYFKCADPTELVNALFDTSGRESDPYYRASFSPSYEEYALTLIRTLKESPSSWIPIAVRTTKDTIGLAIFGELVLFVTRFLGKGNNPPWDESTAVVLLQRAKFISLLYTLQDCFPRGRLIALHTCQKTIINLHNSILCELADKSISHKLSDLEKKLVNLAGTAHYFLNDVFRCYREEKFSYDQRAVVASPSGSYAYIVKRLGMNLRSLKSAPMASLVGKQLEVQMAEIVGGGLPRPDQAPECYKVLLAVDRDYFGQAEATLAKWRTNSRKTTLEDLILSDAALTTEHLTGTVDVGTGPVRASAVLASFASHHLLLLHWSLLCKYLANIMKAGGELILAAPQQVVAAETQVVERGGEMIIVGGAARAREATLLSHILDNLSAYLMSYGETVAAILKILGRSVSSQCPPRLDKWWRDALKNENKIGKSKEEVDEVVQFADEIKRSISKREGTVKTQLSEDLKMLAWCAGLYDDWISPLLPTQASASSPPPGVIFLRSFQVLDIKKELSGHGPHDRVGVSGKGKRAQRPVPRAVHLLDLPPNTRGTVQAKAASTNSSTYPGPSGASGGISNTNITSVTAPSAANSRPELSHLMDFLFKNRKPEIKSFLAEFENLLSQLPNVKRKFDVYSWDGQVYRARPNNGFSLLILRTGRDVLNVMTEIEDMLEQERAMLESTKESTRSETRNSAVVPSQPPTLGDFISTQEEYYDNNSRKGPWLSLAATLVMACKQRELIIAKDVVARFPSLENVSFTFMPPSTGGRTREMRWMAGSVYDSTYDVEWLVVSLDGTLTEELLRQPEKCTQFRDDCPIELLFSVFCRSPSVRIMIVGESVWGWLAHFVLAECVKRWQSRQQRNTLPTYLYSVAFSPVHLNGVLQIDEGLREYCRNAQVAKRMYSVFHRTDTFGPILRIAQEAETIRLNSKKAGLSPLSELLRGFETSKGDLDAMEKTFKRVKTLLENELRMKSRNWLKDDLLGNCIVELRDLVVTPVSFDGVNLLGDRNPPTQNLRSAQYLVETNDTHSNLSADRTSVSEQQKLELDFRFCPQPFISNVFLYVPMNAEAKSGDQEYFLRVIGENLLSVDLNTLSINPRGEGGQIVQSSFAVQSIVDRDDMENTNIYMTAEAKVVGAAWNIEKPPTLTLEYQSIKDRTGQTGRDGEVQPKVTDKVPIKIMNTSPKVSANLALPDLIAKAYYKSVAEIVGSGLTGSGYLLKDLVSQYSARFQLTTSLRKFLTIVSHADASLCEEFDNAINDGLLRKQRDEPDLASIQTIKKLEPLQIRTGKALLKPFEDRVNPPTLTVVKHVAVRAAGAAGAGSATFGIGLLIAGPFFVIAASGAAVAAAIVALSLTESGRKIIDYFIKATEDYNQLMKDHLKLSGTEEVVCNSFRAIQDLEVEFVSKGKYSEAEWNKLNAKEREQFTKERDKCIIPIIELRNACNNCIVLLTSGVKNAGKTRAFLELMNLPIDQRVKAPVGINTAGATQRLFVGRTGLLDRLTTLLIVDTPGINEKAAEVRGVVSQMQQAADLQLMFLPSTVRQEGEMDTAREGDFRMTEAVLKNTTALSILLVYSRQDQGYDDINKRTRAELLETHVNDCKTHERLAKIPADDVIFTAFGTPVTQGAGWDLDRPKDIVQHIFNFLDRRVGNDAAAGFQRLLVTQGIRLSDEPGARCSAAVRLDEVVKVAERATVGGGPAAATGEGTATAAAGGVQVAAATAAASAAGAVARAKAAAQLPVLLEEMEEARLMDDVTKGILAKHGWKAGKQAGGTKNVGLTDLEGLKEALEMRARDLREGGDAKAKSGK